MACVTVALGMEGTCTKLAKGLVCHSLYNRYQPHQRFISYLQQGEETKSQDRSQCSTYSFLPFFNLLRCHVLYFRRRLQYSSESGSSSSSFLGGPRWILKSLGVNAEDVRLREGGQRDNHGMEQWT